MIKFQPLHDRVLIRPPPPLDRIGSIWVAKGYRYGQRSDKTRGRGALAHDDAAGYRAMGVLRRSQVVAVGPECRLVSAGDWVLHPARSGSAEFGIPVSRQSELGIHDPTDQRNRFIILRQSDIDAIDTRVDVDSRDLVGSNPSRSD